jgi:hypothetical protein
LTPLGTRRYIQCLYLFSLPKKKLKKCCELRECKQARVSSSFKQFEQLICDLSVVCSRICDCQQLGFTFLLDLGLWVL